MPFAFESLIVYQKSLVWVEEAETLSQKLKGRVSFSFLDQLSRASLSIPLNIAEGNSRWHKNDKKQFFRIAQGSVFEIVPIIQVLQRRQLIPKTTYDCLYALLAELAKMLSGLIKAVDELKRE